MTWLLIRNYKSFKEAYIKLKRVNVFIGRPNSGKSNLIEALTLLGYDNVSHDPQRSKLIRAPKFGNLIFDNNLREEAFIQTDKLDALIKVTNNGDSLTLERTFAKRFDQSMNQMFEEKEDSLENNKTKDTTFSITSTPLVFFWDSEQYHFSKQQNLKFENPIKRYSFDSEIKIDVDNDINLKPPFGRNMISVLRSTPDMGPYIIPFKTELKLELLIDDFEKEIYFLKQSGMFATKWPWSMTPDTFRRYVFFIAAIITNEKSVLLFEEPEANVYTPYAMSIAENIAWDKKNQYMITTHSTDVLNMLLTKGGLDEVAVHLCYYQDFQTKIHTLDEDVVKRGLEGRIDLIDNINNLIPVEKEDD